MKNSSGNWSNLSKILFPVCAALLCTAFLNAAELKRVNRVLAKIGDEVITTVDLDRMVEPSLEMIKSQFSGEEREKHEALATKSALQRLIADKLLLIEANKLDLTIPEVEVTKRLNAIKAQFATEEEFLASLKQRKLKLDELRTIVADEIKTRVLLQEKVAKRIRVLPSEIHDYYQLNVSKYLQPANVHMFQILVKIQPDRDKAYQRAREIEAELRAGADFQQLARLRSEGPKKSVGGDWGIVEEGFFGDEMASVEKTAFGLKPGQFSSIIETKYGFHIVYVNRKRISRILSEREAYDDIHRRLFEEKFAKAYEDYMEYLRDKTYVEIVDPNIPTSFSLKSETGDTAPLLPDTSEKSE
jgi:parvulin-like peptidyl-prolyl isomerase